MPLTDENRGTNADGSRSEDYCMYCYKNGAFTQDFTMGQMIEFCLQFLDQWNAQAGCFCLQFLDQWNAQAGCRLTPIQAKEQMLQNFPRLKRWKEKDERTLAEKATRLLAKCENVTVASIDANGYPRPVQMSKIGAKGFHEVWMATSADSVKVNDFKANNKAGLCYDHYGDGVALRKCGKTGLPIISPADRTIQIMYFFTSLVRKPLSGLMANFLTPTSDIHETYRILYSKYRRLRSLLRSLPQVLD